MLADLLKVRFLSVHGRRIAYREAGNASSFPVVLIHAFASQSATWIPVGEHLVKAGFRVIALDLPGHGRSDWAADYSLSLIEDDLAVAMDKLELDRFDLMGHSLGGHLALRLSARLSSRVRRLVVEAVPVPPKDVADAKAVISHGQRPSLWRSIRLLGLGRLARIALLRQFDFKAAKPILAELKKPMPQWWLSLDKIHAPCLVVVSASDGMITARASLVMACLRAAELKLIGTGHHLHTNHREAFVEAVMPFLMTRSQEQEMATGTA